MALNFRDYENALKYGAKLVEADYGALSVGSAALQASAVITSNILAGAVTGAKTSLNKYYATVVATSNTGNGLPGGATSIFAGAAPTQGTITGFYIASAGVNGSAVLWGTTAGTIAVIAIGTTIGTVTGTAILNAAVASGDTVTINTSLASGSFTGYVTFQATS